MTAPGKRYNQGYVSVMVIAPLVMPANFSNNNITVAPRTARDSGQFDDHAIIVDGENFYGTGNVTVTLYTVAEFVVENTYNIAHIQGMNGGPTPYYPPVIRFRRICAGGAEDANNICTDTAADTYLRDVNGGFNFLANPDRHSGNVSTDNALARNRLRFQRRWCDCLPQFIGGNLPLRTHQLLRLRPTTVLRFLSRKLEAAVRQKSSRRKIPAIS